jgi:menaquinol-cytochrome c reductase iron-sulfur subunit
MNKRNPSISRNDFVKVVTAFIGSLISTIVGVPAIGYLVSPAARKPITEDWITLGMLEDYPIGKPISFKFTRSTINGWEKTVNSYGVYVIRQDESQVRVFSNICTHLSCLVSWHEDIQNYVSPCHNGHFDMLGEVLSGPPPRPLDEFTTKVEEGDLYIRYPPYRRSS